MTRGPQLLLLLLGASLVASASAAAPEDAALLQVGEGHQAKIKEATHETQTQETGGASACTTFPYKMSVVNDVDDSGEPLFPTEAAVQEFCNCRSSCPGYYNNPTFPRGKQWRPFKPAPGLRPDGFWSPSKFPAVKKKVLCPDRFPHPSPPFKNKICYTAGSYAARGVGPCGSWCTFDINVGGGCGPNDGRICKFSEPVSWHFAASSCPGGRGQSCDMVCGSVGKTCDLPVLKTVTTQAKMSEAASAAGTSCRGYWKGTYGGPWDGPHMDRGGTCGLMTNTNWQPSCGKTPACGWRRVCPCK